MTNKLCDDIVRQMIYLWFLPYRIIGAFSEKKV